MDKISEIENEVLEYGINKMRKNNSINLIDPKDKASVISFTIKNSSSRHCNNSLQMELQSEQDIIVIDITKNWVPATARASIGLYNTKEDIDILLNAIENVRRCLKFNGIKRIISGNDLDHGIQEILENADFTSDAKGHNPLCGDKVISMLI